MTDRTIQVSEAVIRQAVEALSLSLTIIGHPDDEHSKLIADRRDALRSALRQDQTRPCGYCGHRLVDGGPATQCPVGWRCAHADTAALRQDVQQLDDLRQRLAEILNWKRTGMLAEDAALRRFAATMPHRDPGQALRAAEDRTMEMAAMLFLATPPAAPAQPDHVGDANKMVAPAAPARQALTEEQLREVGEGHAYTVSTDPLSSDEWQTSEVVDAFVAGALYAQRMGGITKEGSNHG